MKIEVDQSGKVEKTNRDTVLAFSNGEQYSILIGSNVKQSIFRNKSDRKFKIKFFAICVYLLLKNKVNGKELIIIDEEYAGNNRIIKQVIYGLIKDDFPEFDKRSIIFGRVTKKSNAHNIAILTYRKILKPNKIIKEEEILELL